MEHQVPGLGLSCRPACPGHALIRNPQTVTIPFILRPILDGAFKLLGLAVRFRQLLVSRVHVRPGRGSFNLVRGAVVDYPDPDGNLYGRDGLGEQGDRQCCY